MKNSLIIILVVLNIIFCSGQKLEKEKMNLNNKELLKEVLDPKIGINLRIQAINQLDLQDESTDLIQSLKNILIRQKPEPNPNMKGWDPLAGERVIDIHIIEALNKLEITTENKRIPDLVSQAIPFIREFGDERKEDARVIKSINDKNVYAEIIALTQSKDPTILENAVVTLNNINFPNAPLGGEVSSILPPEKKEFKFSRLKEEMELYIKKSEGKIKLSNEVIDFINTNNLERGNVNLELSLVAIVEKVLVLLNFDYYIENNTVIICTHTESAKRWQDWWNINQSNYD